MDNLLSAKGIIIKREGRAINCYKAIIKDEKGNIILHKEVKIIK